MFVNNKKTGFTLVELIVVIAILAILATIGFISLFGYQLKTRDSVRISDIGNISKAISLTKLQDGIFPTVSNSINITFSGSTIWKQGTFGLDSYRTAKILTSVPLDPLTNSEYAYSVTQSTGEYQVGGIIEGTIAFVPENFTNQSYAATTLPDFLSTYITGNYNEKFLTHIEPIDDQNKQVYILGVPSILSNEVTSVTLGEIIANNSFLYNGKKLAPSSYSGAVSTGSLFTFTPTQTPHGASLSSTGVVYVGTSSELSSGAGKLELVNNLKTYYSNSNIETEDSIKDIMTVDTGTDPNDAISIVNVYVGVGMGGLESSKIQKTTITSSSSGGGGGGGWPTSCMDMTATQLANLNAWANITIFSGRGAPSGLAETGTSSHTKADICTMTAFEVDPSSGLVMLEELGLLLDSTYLYSYDNSLTVLPESLQYLTKLEELDLESNPGLGNLDAYFDMFATKVCQAGITTLGNQMCVEGNGTTIDITIE